MSLETTQVELKSVGLVLTLSQSNWRITRKKDRLIEQGAQYRKELRETPDLIDEDEVTMREIFYPIIASCVISDNCPTIEDCMEKISQDDLELWYQAARTINPGWFAVLDKITDLVNQEEEERANAALKKGMTSSGTISDEKTPERSLTV
jgi:hypothetical protein